MNRVALGQGKRQLDRGAFVEDIGTVTGGAGKDRRAGWAALRGEERPIGRMAPADKGFLGKLRDAFKGA